MNETLKTIFDRYSCRDFAPEPLTDEQVETLVKTALAAPSAMNLQPWHIIAVKDKLLIEELDAEIMSFVEAQGGEFYERMKARGGKALYNAPCMIIIAKDDSKDSAVLDCGIATQNIALAAHSMGLASVICGMMRIPLNGEKGAEFTKRLKLPEGYSFGMSVLLGNAKSGKEPHELDMNKVTYI